MSVGARRLFKSSRYAQSEAKELLQSIFVAELIRPSKQFWIVSPWISDLAVIDNTAMTFGHLDPAWGARLILLSEVITQIADRGGRVMIVTRPDELNQPFLRRLNDRLSADRSDAVRIAVRRDLHEKGILSELFHLGGSMNLTYLGVEINEEALILDTDPDTIARTRREYSHRYGPDLELT